LDDRLGGEKSSQSSGRFYPGIFVDAPGISLAALTSGEIVPD
jgi:hypothetical protein